jgi:hypothetical protein
LLFLLPFVQQLFEALYDTKLDEWYFSPLKAVATRKKPAESTHGKDYSYGSSLCSWQYNEHLAVNLLST